MLRNSNIFFLVQRNPKGKQTKKKGGFELSLSTVECNKLRMPSEELEANRRSNHEMPNTGMDDSFESRRYFCQYCGISRSKKTLITSHINSHHQVYFSIPFLHFVSKHFVWIDRFSNWVDWFSTLVNQGQNKIQIADCLNANNQNQNTLHFSHYLVMYGGDMCLNMIWYLR
jgi:hypothetical protein